MNYHEVLGLSKSATQDEIKKAYRRLAMQYHPDRNKDPGAINRFKEIQEAYDVLINNKKPNKVKFNKKTEKSDDLFSDLWTNFAKKTSNWKPGKKAKNINKTITISFMESMFGCEKEVDVERYEKCYKCNGDGFVESIPCEKCGGTGTYSERKGPFFISMICKFCNGKGRISKGECADCHGEGKILEEIKKVNVKINPGIINGMQVIVRGKGYKELGKEPGNLILTVLVEEDKKYKRKNNDVYTYFEAHYIDFLLGSKIKLKGIWDTVEFNLPPKTQPGTKFRIKKQGAIDPKSNQHNFIFGDLILISKLKMPEITDDIKKIAENLKNFNA